MVSTNTEYYLRLLLLVVNVATPVLSETFLNFVTKSSKKTVDGFLKIFEDGFKALKIKRIIKDSELKKLFSNSGKTVIEEWDISLLCLVLSHSCSLEGKLYQLKDILLKEAKYDINSFVLTNKNTIYSMKGAELDDEEYAIVFPSNYSDTNFEKWNINLTIQIALKLCPTKKKNIIKVLRDTFVQEIDLKCSSIDINEFLNIHLSTLVDIKNKGKLSQAQFDNLFPDTGSDINTWDDHTLVVVLLNTASTLTKRTINSLKKIRSIRSNSLAHRGDAEIELSEFSEKRIELTKAVIKILEEEKQPVVEVKQKISNIVDGPLELKSSIDCLKAYFTKESLESDTILGALDTVCNAVDSIGVKVETGFGKIDSRLDAFLEHLDNIERKLPDSAYTEKAEIRCVDMIFVIKSETVEKKEKAESIIMNAMKPAKQNTTEQILAAFNVIRKIITEDGKTIVEIKRGSVIVVIKCISLKGFHRLLKYAQSGKIQTHLANAASALDDLLGKHTEITVSMSYDSLVNASEDIVNYLSDYIDHTSHLKMTIERDNVQDLQNLVREFQVGEGATQLRIVSTKLSDYLGENISVDAVTPKISKDQHHFKGTSDIFDGTNVSSLIKLDLSKNQLQLPGISDILVGASIATSSQFELASNKLQLPGTSDKLEETNIATLRKLELSENKLQLPVDATMTIDNLDETSIAGLSCQSDLSESKLQFPDQMKRTFKTSPVIFDVGDVQCLHTERGQRSSNNEMMASDNIEAQFDTTFCQDIRLPVYTSSNNDVRFFSQPCHDIGADKLSDITSKRFELSPFLAGSNITDNLTKSSSSSTHTTTEQLTSDNVSSAELIHKDHNRDIKVKCEYCGKGFKNYINFSTHIRIHTGEKHCRGILPRHMNMNHRYGKSDNTRTISYNKYFSEPIEKHQPTCVEDSKADDSSEIKFDSVIDNLDFGSNEGSS